MESDPETRRRREVVALVVQMAGDQAGIRMALQQAIAMSRQFLIEGTSLPWKLKV